MTLRPHLFRPERHAGVERVEQLGHVVVGDRNTFGHTGGARGVDDVRDVIGCRRRQRGARLGLDAGIVDVDDQQIDPSNRSLSAAAVTATIGAESSVMNLIRAGGCAGSIGR